jgi:hypothetical protein
MDEPQEAWRKRSEENAGRLLGQRFPVTVAASLSTLSPIVPIANRGAPSF